MEQGGDQHHVVPGDGGIQLEENVGGEALLPAALSSAVILVPIVSSMPREDMLISMKLISAVGGHAWELLPFPSPVPCQ